MNIRLIGLLLFLHESRHTPPSTVLMKETMMKVVIFNASFPSSTACRRLKRAYRPRSCKHFGKSSSVRCNFRFHRLPVVVAGHRDRLGRVNTELVEAALSAHNRRLVVLDSSEVTDDLVRDIVEVLTSFCARLYGRRSARNRALKALGCAQQDIGPKAVKLQASGGAV